MTKQIVKCRGVRNAGTNWPEPCGYVIGFIEEGEKFTGNTLCSECEAAELQGATRQSIVRTPADVIRGMGPEDIALLKALLKEPEREPEPAAKLDRTTGKFNPTKEAA